MNPYKIQFLHEITVLRLLFNKNLFYRAFKYVRIFEIQTYHFVMDFNNKNPLEWDKTSAEN
ncbi:hypothetical protein [Leptospira noguchii]|uniref:hypothetical protein n=1 Tax=Leptospira noguchii TaxID=28182 RepID=UPI001FB5AC13|nr:hypothetical protein [Leptospira noguchii]UOG40412.1 hypothetical protein MAL05_10955 [Leptospira noguchii]